MTHCHDPRGLISGVIVYSLEAEGHGTDTVVKAFHGLGGFIRARLAPVKKIASAITIGSGGAAGREGPKAYSYRPALAVMLSYLLQTTLSSRLKRSSGAYSSRFACSPRRAFADGSAVVERKSNFCPSRR